MARPASAASASKAPPKLPENPAILEIFPKYTSLSTEEITKAIIERSRTAPIEESEAMLRSLIDKLRVGGGTDVEHVWDTVALPAQMSDEEALKAIHVSGTELCLTLIHLLNQNRKNRGVAMATLSVLGILGTNERGDWWKSGADDIGAALGHMGGANLQDKEILRFVALVVHRLAYQEREILARGTRDMLCQVLEVQGDDELVSKWVGFAISNLVARNTVNQDAFLEVPAFHGNICKYLDKHTWDKGACRGIVTCIGNLTCDHPKNADAFYTQGKELNKELATLLHRILRVWGFEIDIVCATFTTIANVVFRHDKHGWAFLEQGARFTDEVQRILIRFSGMDHRLEPNAQVIRCGAFMIFRMTIRNAMWAMAARHRVAPALEAGLARFKDNDDLVLWVEKCMQELERFK